MATSSKTKKAVPPKQKNTWKRKRGEDLELPSGNVALVKRPGMEAFLREGMIPDSLMPIVNEAITKGKGLPPEKLAEMSKDMGTVLEMMDSMDRVVCNVVIEPAVRYHKVLMPDLMPGGRLADSGLNVGDEIPEGAREDEYVYTDDIDFEDKAFIFNSAVGGTRDLERFRTEAKASVDAVQAVEGVRDPAE